MKEGVFCARQRTKIVNNKKFTRFIGFIVLKNSTNSKNSINSINALCCLLFALFCIPLSLEAKVTGICVNCHTMHNSQNGANMQHMGPGESDTGPKNLLLRGTCIGCHSATNGSTWKDPFTGAPIVFNTSAPTYGASSDGVAHQGLAGGNFYWVATAGGHDDAKGHNVLGISAQDATLSAAPGGGWCAGSCHYSLATVPGDSFSTYVCTKGNGCQGCHVTTKHHVDEGVYRFTYHHFPCYSAGNTVRGQGDPNWEYNPTQSIHNTYIGDSSHSSITGGGGNISGFCSGCHGMAGWFQSDWSFGFNQPASSPWLRHPNDYVLPASSEYDAYTAYNPIVPVARPEGGFPADPSQVRPGTDMVMCISCHRAHGSPYFKMLRWDYTGWPGNAQTVGCSTCHSSKD
jgi:hypothetical protein